MNEKSSSIVGFALIGLILIGGTWISSNRARKQAEARKVLAEQQSEPVQDIYDSNALPQDTVAVDSVNAVAVDSSAILSPLANQSVTEYYTLSNDNLSFTVSSRGAQPYEVIVKDYFKYDSTALNIVGRERSEMNVELNTSHYGYLNTSDYCFSKVSESDSSVTLRLSFSDSSYIDACYKLRAGEYMVDYSLSFIGMDMELESTSSQATLSWVLDMPRMEKGYKNEKDYSSVAFRYAGENGSVKSIGQRKESVREEFTTRLRWTGFQQQFFSAIILADNGFSGGTLVNRFYPETDPEHRLMQSGSNLSFDLDSRSDKVEVPFHLYFGPNHLPTLRSYGEDFEKIIPMGGKLVSFISRFVIIPLFDWLSRGINSFGLIILLMTIIIKIVIMPLTWKSYASSAKMKVLKPEIDKINAKYPKKEDAMKKQQATMDLYKKAGVSVFGGCLPILLQFPILWAMFRFFPASIELRQQDFLWAADLSTYDSILDFGFKIPLYGDHISLFALLMGISMWAYSRVTLSQMDNSSMPGMKFMQVWFMPIFMVVICNNFSAGLSYYYMLSNLFTIGQSIAIRKWFIDEDKIYAKLKEKTSSSDAPKKSKFQQRLDAMYKAQQEQLKKQKK